MKALLLLVIIVLLSGVSAMGQARTAERIVSVAFSSLDTGNPPDGSIRNVINGTPGTTPCQIGVVNVMAFKSNGVWQCPALTPGGGGGAPISATFITQTPNATLTAEQALSLLGTGLLKSTTGTGVLSIAVAGTDYLTPTGNGSGLTALNASALSTGTVPPARVITGAVTNSKCLRVNASGQIEVAADDCGTGSGGGLADPGSNGIIKRTALNITAPAVAGTDYLAPTGSGAALTGITFSQLGGAATDAQIPDTITLASFSQIGGSVTDAQVPDTITLTSFSQIGGSVTDAQVPNTITVDLATLATTATSAETGDSATAFFSAGSIEATRGGTGLGAPADNQIIVGNASSAFIFATLPSCSNGVTDKLLYNSTTRTFSCGADQTTGGGSGITSLGTLTASAQTLSKTDDTNVTLTITSVTADHNFALGWTGTLADARVADDITLTNITQITNRAISDTTGDLAASRIDDGAVAATQALFSGAAGAAGFRAIADADVPNTITIDLATVATTANAGDSATAFFSAGALEKARQHAATVYTDQANTWSTGAQDFSAVTSLTVPVAAGANPTASGTIAYDSTVNELKYGANGSNRTIASLQGAQTLTNKAISGASNTLSNIGNSSLTNSSVTIGSTSVSLGGTAATVAGLTLTSPTVAILKPAADSTTAIRFTMADGATNIGVIDTTNGRLGINVTPAHSLDILKAQNAGTYAQIKNTTVGTAAVAGFYAVNDTGGASFGVPSSGYTSSGISQANYAVLASDTLLGGLNIGTIGTGDPVRVYTADTLRVTIDSTAATFTTTINAPIADFPEAAAPATPAANTVRLYAKADGLLYSKDDAGTETAVSGGGAGGGDVTAASAFGTDNVLIRSDGTGKGVQATGITIADTTNNLVSSGTATFGSGSAEAGGIFLGAGTAQSTVASNVGIMAPTSVTAYNLTVPSAIAAGLFATNSSGVMAFRTITGTSNEITVTNGDGASGNPTLALSATVNLTSKIFRLPNSATLPATCTVGDAYMDTDATTGQRFYLCQAADTWVLQGDGGGGGGANTSLNNLASVAINTALISDTNNTDDLGTSSLRWKDIYGMSLDLGGSGAGYIELAEGTAPTVVANRLTFTAPADAPAAGLLYVLPADAPTNGEQLTANISGTTVTLSWDSAGAGGLPSGLTFASPDFTVATAAANQIVLSGSVTTSPVLISATGSDTNIDIKAVPKGTGGFRVGTDTIFTNDVWSFGASTGTQTVNMRDRTAGSVATVLSNGFGELIVGRSDATVAIAGTHLVPGSDNAKDVGTSSAGWRTGYFDTSVVFAGSTSGTVTLQAAAVAGTNTLTLPAATGTLATTAAATESAAGLIEIATTAEINTGTDATRAMAPDQFAASNFGTRVVQVVAFDFATNTAVGDGKFYFVVPEELNGMILVGVRAQVVDAGTTNATNVDLARCATAATGNACSGTVVDMLSTNITIDSGENSTDTAAAAAVIDAANDDVATGQIIRVDVDAVSTTVAKGLIVTMKFRLP